MVSNFSWFYLPFETRKKMNEIRHFNICLMFKNLVATNILFCCESIFTIKPQFQTRIAELSCKHNLGLKRLYAKLFYFLSKMKQISELYFSSSKRWSRNGRIWPMFAFWCKFNESWNITQSIYKLLLFTISNWNSVLLNRRSNMILCYSLRAGISFILGWKCLMCEFFELASEENVGTYNKKFPKFRFKWVGWLQSWDISTSWAAKEWKTDIWTIVKTDRP